MKRNPLLSTLIVCLTLVLISCGGSTFQDDTISLELPSGWSKGIIEPAGSFVMVETRPVNTGDSISTLVSEFELQVTDASMESKASGVLINGVPKETDADILYSIDDRLITRRQIEIEVNRLNGLIQDKPADQIYQLAEINVKENIHFMLGARDFKLSVSQSQIEDEVDYSISDIKSSGTPRNIFLYGWGITIDEFKNVVRQKMLYGLVLPRINDMYDGLNEAESSIEFLSESMSTYPTQQIEGNAEKIKIVILKSDKCFIIIKGVIYFKDQERNVDNILDSLISQKDHFELGDIYIFSQEQ